MLLVAKEQCIALGDAADADLYTTALSVLEASSLDALFDFEAGIKIAVVQPFGDAGPSIPLAIALPSWATAAAGQAIRSSVDRMKAVYAQTGGVRRWE